MRAASISSCRSRAGPASAATTRAREWSFETFTWAAGLAALTSRIAIFSTVHVPLVHPIYAAKALATVDHISGGRAGLNIVCGWNPTEFAMFGTTPDERAYERAAEWIDDRRARLRLRRAVRFRRRLLQAEGRRLEAGEHPEAAAGDDERRLRRAGPRFRLAPLRFPVLHLHRHRRRPAASRRHPRARRGGRARGRRLHGLPRRLPARRRRRRRTPTTAMRCARPITARSTTTWPARSSSRSRTTSAPIATTASASPAAPAAIRWSARRRRSPRRSPRSPRRAGPARRCRFLNYTDELPFFIERVFPLLREAGLEGEEPRACLIPSRPTPEARLRGRERPLGVFWFALGNVALIEMAVAAGAEAIVIDMQHGLFDRATLEAAIGSVPPQVPCLVRVEDDSADGDRPRARCRRRGRHRAAGRDGSAGGSRRRRLPLSAEGHPLRRRHPPAARFRRLCRRRGRRDRRRRDDRDEEGRRQRRSDRRARRMSTSSSSAPATLRCRSARRPAATPMRAPAPRSSKACRKAGTPCGTFTFGGEAAAAKIAEGYCADRRHNDVSAMSASAAASAFSAATRDRAAALAALPGESGARRAPRIARRGPVSPRRSAERSRPTRPAPMPSACRGATRAPSARPRRAGEKLGDPFGMRRGHLGENLRPASVRRTRTARRSASGTLRSIRPACASRSTRPVTLPFDTIMRRDSSPSSSPSSTRSSCASRSKRGSVVSKCSRSRCRTSTSIRFADGEQPQPEPELHPVVLRPLGDLRFRVDVVVERIGLGSRSADCFLTTMSCFACRASRVACSNCFMSKQTRDADNPRQALRSARAQRSSPSQPGSISGSGIAAFSSAV